MQVFAEQHNRAFGYAVAASVALHAIVLFLKMPALRESLAPPAAPALEARLVEPARPPAPVVEASKPPAAEPSGPVAAARPTVQLPDTGSLEQFRQQLIGVAVRYKRYPRMALDNG